jgi:hypothetical protein
MRLSDEFEVGVHVDLPKTMRRELRAVFPGRDVAAVLTTAQRAAYELVRWCDDVDREKDVLLERVRVQVV